MAELLAILTPIGFLDSTTFVPLCIALLVTLLAGSRPVLHSAALILSIFVVYFVSGLLILLGLQSIFDEISARAARIWTDPETEELIFQILLGIALCVFGARIAARRRKSDKKFATGMTLIQVLLAGAGLALVGLPGSVTYLAAIDLILRAELALAQESMALGFYNVVYVLPLAVIVFVRLALGERSQGVFDATKLFFDRWGQRVIVALLIVFGLILVVDGIGWLLGHPLIPV